MKDHAVTLVAIGMGSNIDAAKVNTGSSTYIFFFWWKPCLSIFEFGEVAKAVHAPFFFLSVLLVKTNQRSAD